MKVATRRLLDEQIAAVVVLGRGEKNDAMWHKPHLGRYTQRQWKTNLDYIYNLSTGPRGVGGDTIIIA